MKTQIIDQEKGIYFDGKTVWANEQSTTDPDSKILDTPAREFVENWIKDPKRTKEELEAGIKFITKDCTERLDVSLITPQMLRKLHSPSSKILQKLDGLKRKIGGK